MPEVVNQTQQGPEAGFIAHDTGIAAHGVAQDLEIGRIKDRRGGRPDSLSYVWGEGIVIQVLGRRNADAFTEGGGLQQAV